MAYKSLRIVRLFLVPLIAFTFAYCQKEQSNQEETIPLDGRSGGVLAYCLQPSTALEVHSLYGINADGTGNRKLISAPIGLNHHDWSPSGTKIATSGYSSQTTTSIYSFNSNGTDLTRLTNSEGKIDSDPAWSPDETRIVFTRSDPASQDFGNLWIMNSDGSNQHSLGIKGYYAEWSPDGSKLIYSSDKSGNSDIYTCLADGKGEVNLTNSVIQEWFPQWSHSGNRITFSAYTGNPDDLSTSEIFIINSDGTGLTRLTEDRNFDTYPRWSPDDSKISFASDRSVHNHWEVYIMNSDGTGIKRVTFSTGGQTSINAVWRPVN